MAGVRDLLVRFGGQVDASLPQSADKASREIGKVGDSADRQSGRARGAFGAIGGAIKGVAAPLAALAAGGQVVETVWSSIAEAQESRKVAATTEQIIKQTGGAAKITADGIGQLAEAISNKIGVDDEAVQAGANLLLTFKNVRNEAGKGADIFNRATMAAQDLAAAGFGDAESSAKMLGKALNDPAKGITALSRAGVTFTEQQKKQIKAMQESGDILGAQKIIMAEVESQVGGVAAKSATAQEKLTVMWGNLQEQLGGLLLPALDKVTAVLGEHVIPAVSAFLESFDNPDSGISKVAATVGAGITRIKDLALGLYDVFAKGDFTGTLGSALGVDEDSPIIDVLFRIREAGVQLVGWWQGTAAPALAGAWDAIQPRFAAFGEWFEWTLVPAIISAGESIAAYVGKLTAIGDQIGAVIVDKWSQWGPTISGYVSQVGQIVTEVFGFIQVYATRVAQVITAVWDRIGPTVLKVVGVVFDTLVKVIGGALNIIQGIIRTATALLTGDWSKAWEGIKQIFRGAWQVIGGILSGAVAVLKAIFTPIGGWFADQFEQIKTSITSKATQIKDGTVAKFRQLKDGIVGLFAGIGATIGQKFAGVTDAIASPLRGAAQWLNSKILSPMSGVTSKFGVSIPLIPKFHSGGMVPGRDELLALLKGQEGVLTEKGVAAIGGPAALDAANRGEPIGGAGPVGGIMDWLDKPAQWLKDVGAKGLEWALGKLFGVLPDLSKTPPPMAGQLLQGTANQMKAAAMKWARGKDEAEKATAAPPAVLTGNRAWPTTIRTLSGSYPGHSGLDFPVPTGTPLYAVTDGSISYVGFGRGYGNAIFANFGGMPAVYGHGSKPLVKAGDRVTAGQVIGLSGNTGNSTGPHLHFEVAPGGGFANAGNRAATFKWLGYDAGGWLPPGVTPTVNNTGRPEAILTAEQWERLLSALEGLAAAGSTTVIDGRSLRAALRDEVTAEISARDKGEVLL